MKTLISLLNLMIVLAFVYQPGILLLLMAYNILIKKRTRELRRRPGPLCFPWPGERRDLLSEAI